MSDIGAGESVHLLEACSLHLERDYKLLLVLIVCFAHQHELRGGGGGGGG